ncbi:hypothetical protein ACVWZK_009441 [Bradyrhizobium sp. GM0.4]
MVGNRQVPGFYSEQSRLIVRSANIGDRNGARHLNQAVGELQKSTCWQKPSRYEARSACNSGLFWILIDNAYHLRVLAEKRPSYLGCASELHTWAPNPSSIFFASVSRQPILCWVGRPWDRFEATSSILQVVLGKAARVCAVDRAKNAFYKKK